jgi:hypothetical protein
MKPSLRTARTVSSSVNGSIEKHVGVPARLRLQIS